MSGAPRPWWASDPDAAGGADDDPVMAHRAARRGRVARDAAADARAGDDEAGQDGPGQDGAGQDGAGQDGAGDAADGHATAGSAGDARRDTFGEGRPGSVGDHAGAGHDPASEVCGVCPLCVLARALGDSRPELLGHLAEAARHLSAAVRTVTEPSCEDAAPTGTEDEDRCGPADPAGPRRIDLDP